MDAGIAYLAIVFAAIGGFVIAWPTALIRVGQLAADGWMRERGTLLNLIERQTDTLEQQREAMVAQRDLIDRLTRDLPAAHGV